MAAASWPASMFTPAIQEAHLQLQLHFDTTVSRSRRSQAKTTISCSVETCGNSGFF